MNDLLQRLRSEAPAAGLYALAAAALILSQHAMVALACRVLGAPPAINDMFWLFPIRQLAMRPDIALLAAIGGFAFCLAISGILARLLAAPCRSARTWRLAGAGNHDPDPADPRRASRLLCCARAAREDAPEQVGDLRAALSARDRHFCRNRADRRRGRGLRADDGRLWLGPVRRDPFLVGLITGFLVNCNYMRSAAETFGASRRRERWARLRC